MKNNINRSKRFQIQHNTRLPELLKRPEYQLFLKKEMEQNAKRGIPLTDGIIKDIALTEGVWIEANILEKLWTLQIEKLKHKYPALEKHNMPNIVAVYISSSHIYDIIRGKIKGKRIKKEYGMTQDEWNKKYISMGFLMAFPDGYQTYIGLEPTYLIVIRHKPRNFVNLNHEIRHVIEVELDLGEGALNKVKTK